ncbi:MAG: exosortase X [Bacteroidia bacterium]
MLSINFNSKITRFFLLAAGLYILWLLIYEFVIKVHTHVDDNLIKLIINTAQFLLSAIGYTTYTNTVDVDFQFLGIDGAHPVWVGSPCNALTLFAFFTFFVIAFPDNGKNKLWFIPLGILIIHAANILRVMGLVLINYYAPKYLEFNHTYTFTILVYALIFAMWMWWVNFSLKKSKQHEPKI